jgi:Pentapeptide repeats (8 copies)
LRASGSTGWKSSGWLPAAHKLTGPGRIALQVPDLHLEHANLHAVYLEDALLNRAHLEGVNLFLAHLEGANLSGAHLERASLFWAHLERTDLFKAHLEGADLRRASFDKTTQLGRATLTGALFDQAIFDNTSLSDVEWADVSVLGDELSADRLLDDRGKPKSRADRARGYGAAGRAYRLLATTLQSQGGGDDADHYAYRAQVMKRRQLWYQRHRGAYFFSGFLSLSAGYGYRLRRVFGVYALVVLLFAISYLLARLLTTHASLTWQAAADAAQISLNAIHGRVFFAQFQLDTFQSWLATIESLLGIVIEGVFVAVLIQRLFSR